MVTNYGSTIHQIPATALDPDALERTYGAAVTQNMEPGYAMPFLMGVMMDRQRRAQQLTESNAAANTQAYNLAQQGMALDERGQLRTLAGTLAGHGMPVTPSLMTPGGMPTLAENQQYAAAGNPLVMQGAAAQAAQRYGEAARGAGEGGVDPVGLLASTGLPGQTASVPVRVQAAGAGNAARVPITTTTTGPNGDVVSIVNTRQATSNPGAVAGNLANSQNITRNAVGQSMARQALQQNSRLAANVRADVERATRAGSRVIDQSADANSYSVTVGQGSQQETRRYDRTTGQRIP